MIPSINKLPPEPSFGDIVNKINSLVGELTNVLLNLDSINVVSLTADHIDAGTIDANVVTLRSDLQAGAYVKIDGNGLVINNGSFDTFKADINGAVTMTRALIQSGAGYPKVVMDPDTTLFGAYSTASRYVKMESDPGTLGAANVKFGFDDTETQLVQVGETFHIFGPSSKVNFSVRRTDFSGAVNVGGISDLRTFGGQTSSTPEEAVTNLNNLMAFLRSMGILA